MPAVPFARLPDDARLWVFGASERLTDDQWAEVLATVDAFLDEWHAHGHPVHAGRAVEHDQFLLIGVDEAATQLSGCSIDGMVRELTQLQTRLGTTLVDGSSVFFRDGGRVERMSRAEFKARALDGQVTLSTSVFDTTLATVGELRAGRFEVVASESWHRQAFFPEAHVA